MRELIGNYALRLTHAGPSVIWLAVTLSATLIAAELMLGRMAAAILGLTLPLGLAGWIYRQRRRQTRADTPPDMLSARLFQEADARMTTPSLCLALTFEGVDLDTAGRALDIIERRLRSQVRSGDRILRNGASGFLVLPDTGWTDLERSVQFAVRLQKLCARPIALDGRALSLTPTVGFARASREANDQDTLIARAEASAESAYLAGPGEIRGWTPAIQDDIALRLSMKTALTRAFELGHITPWFQPQVSTDTGEITGVEVLSRWEHPERGLIPPGDFLPYIATAGLSSRLTRTMIDGALTALAAWQDEGLHVPRASVNLSPQDLADPGLGAMILRRLERHGLPPERLGVEVLESVAATESDGVIIRNLTMLETVGCHIDIDDFGIGNTSVAALRRLPIRRLKIDRSFITRVDTDRDQQGLVSAFLTIAEQLGLETLGEGVETQGEHAMLAQLGCAHVQGFGIGRPMPANQIPGWAAEYRASLPDARLASPRGPDDPGAARSAAMRGKTRQSPNGKTA